MKKDISIIYLIILQSIAVSFYQKKVFDITICLTNSTEYPDIYLSMLMQAMLEIQLKIEWFTLILMWDITLDEKFLH